MKPIINVAVAILLSFGLVACGSGGSGNGNHTTATTAKHSKDPNHIDYIELNNTASSTINLSAQQEYKEELQYSFLTANKLKDKVLVLGRPNNHEDETPLAYKDDLAQLDAKYEGSVLIALNEGGDSQVEKRKVQFNVKQNNISGHSVKYNDINDVQVVFKDTQIGTESRGEEDYLGFIGKAEVMKGQKTFSHAEYFGSFAGPQAQEITGGFIDKIHDEPDMQPKVSGGFIATQVVKDTTTSPQQ
ncbi:hypothetical protein [Pasteurella sp. PK-2025]|uniref:hypothetical protein n=1 Tax=Pasteurella sp. PK-2025 TaxID=3413133 RepID=UPI003C719B40